MQSADLVFFYSDPLVDNKNGQLVSTGFIELSTNEEYLDLVRTLKATEKEFTI